MNDRFDELFGDYLEGELDSAGLEELEALLKSRPELADRAADLYETHRGLGLLHQAGASELFARSTLDRLKADREGFVGAVRERLASSRSTGSSRPWVGYALVAAATLLFSFILQTLLVTKPVPLTTVVGPVATLVRSEKAHWEPERSLAEGGRLGLGPLRLSGGKAVLLFDGGAVLALEGPVDLEVESRGSVRLKHGKVSVRAELDAAGFIVHTPAGVAVDLGTEFVVTVAPSGETEVHVQQGEVAWSPEAGHPPSQVLKSGQAMSFQSSDGGKGRSIAFIAHSLEDYLRQRSHDLLPARPTALEDFEYEAGDSPTDLLSGGSGWTGSWRLRRGVEITREGDGVAGMRLLADSLRGSWTPAPERGGALALPPGHNFYIRQLSDPVDLGRDAVYYLSFLVRREADALPGATEIPHFRLTLRSSADYWGPSIAAGYPYSRRPTVQFQTRGSFVAQNELSIGATSLWVLKIVSGRTKPDEIFLKVFKSGEALPEFDPSPWSVATGPLPADGVLDLIVVTGTGPATHVFDGLRVGRTWDSVVRRD